ncbi:MAG TPA: FAD:protein FMN transferase [Nocardioidaceae bacterium]|nr:FAD:protein FMN transferase [Nocardioidaceae bacterium]
MTGTATGLAVREWTLWSTLARLVVTDEATLAPALTTVDEYLRQVDDAANRFRADSEISRLRPGEAELSPVLRDLLEQALWAAELTGGDVDPTVGGPLERLGYDRDLELVLDDGTPARAVIHVLPRWGSVVLHGSRVWLPAGVRLDLGATAKAAAADRAAALVHESTGSGVLVSLGGDIGTAGPAPEGGWQVRVQDAPDDPPAQVALPAETGIATSSTVSRTWRHGGRRLHHILDPRTGQPAPTFWRSVTVAASTCLQANAVSTACIVRGACAVDWVQRLGLPARFLTYDGRVLTTDSWPTGDPLGSTR